MMALLLMTGFAGTGKTLYAIQRYIIPELSKGTKVFTNIDGIILSRISMLFDIDIIELERKYVNLKNPSRFWEEMEKNSMAVLDESQNIFNNRDWQNANNKDCIKYLMEHRHFGHQLIFITPHIDSLDAGIRRVCEFTYKHKSFSAVGSKKTVRCAIFTQANTNVEPVKFINWRHDERVYDCYSSYFEKGTIEKKPRVNIFKSSKLIFFVLLCFIMMLIAMNNIPKFYNEISKSKQKKIVEIGSKKEVKRNFIMIGDSLIDGFSKGERVIK
jgi:zona occludens toxin